MLQWIPFEPGMIALIGIVLAGSLGGSFSGQISRRNHTEASLLKGAFLMVVLSIVVVVLGLSALIITPILPLVVLIGAVRLLPIGGRRAQISFLIIGCLSIGLGAAMSIADLPSSEIAAMKLLGLLFH